MPYCPVCKTEIFSSKLKTISGQIVCSLSCVGLLESIKTDQCNYCQRPVWSDNYYKIENKYFCSTYCKDMAVNQVNKMDNYNNIQHFNENYFSNTKPLILKNTEKLRNEVLKFYKDFKFEANENLNIENIPEFKKITNINSKNMKYHKSSNSSFRTFKISRLNQTEIGNKYQINISREKIDRENKNKMLIDRINNKNIFVVDSYGKKDSQNKKRIYLNENKYLDTKEKVFETKDKYKPQISLYNKNTFQRDKNKDDYISNKVNIHLNKTIDNKKTRLKDNIFKKPNAYDSNNWIESSHLINNYNSSYDLSRNDNIFQANSIIKNNITSKNTSRIGIKKTPICKTCLRKLGNATFLDRNGNRFCSDECKSEFLQKHQ